MSFSNKKITFSLFVSSFLTLALIFSSFLYVTAIILPKKSELATEDLCAEHLKEKSYQLKQLILENINNSKQWVLNRKNSFFDSRWFAITYYESFGGQWFLKDYKLGDIAQSIYNTKESHYIKSDLEIVFPHPRSEQVTFNENKIDSLPLFLLDIPNQIEGSENNTLIRVSLFPESLTTLLDSNKNCPLSFFKSNGTLILDKAFTKNEPMPEISPDAEAFNDKLRTKITGAFETQSSILTKKIFRNLYITVYPKEFSFFYMRNINKILVANLILWILVISILVFIFYQYITRRIGRMTSLLSKDPFDKGRIYLNDLKKDELSYLEEKLIEISDPRQTNKK